jgi:hypothetical protein
MRRRLRFLFCTLIVCAIGAPAVAYSASGTLVLNYRGKVRISEGEAIAKDQNGATFTITGLSGIAYLGNDTYIAVMDNSNHLVALGVRFDKDGKIIEQKILGGDTIADSRDYEGVAFTNTQRNSVFLSDEAGPKATQKIYEYTLGRSGKLLQSIDLPPVFATLVSNRGLESLTRRADGKEMWTANEEALAADGPVSTDKAGTVVRLQRFTVNGNTVTPSEEYAYVTEPIHAGIGKPICNGLSDLVVLPDGTLLALERSAIEGLPPLETRIYQIDFSGATDISRGALAKGLIGQKYTPVKKTLLFDANASGNPIGENLEGLCLGPKLASGNWALLGVVDNGDPVSKNTLVSFELVYSQAHQPLPMPVLAASSGGALAVLLALRIFRSGRRSY